MTFLRIANIVLFACVVVLLAANRELGASLRNSTVVIQRQNSALFQERQVVEGLKAIIKAHSPTVILHVTDGRCDANPAL